MLDGSMKTKVAVIQMNSCSAVGPNLLSTKLLIQKAAAQGAKLIILPENFACMGKTLSDLCLIKEIYGDLNQGRIQSFISQMAQDLKIWIVGGTIPIACEDKTKIRSACMVWDSEGIVVARYDKIHLFDVLLAGNCEQYEESVFIQPGQKAIVIPTPFGKLGLAICYDLRFSELFIEMRNQGAEIIALPSAFTATTGRTHWKPLIQSRAIEFQSYILAANQTGKQDNNRHTFGHSMIVGPWGDILTEHPQGVGYQIAEIDLLKLQILREDFPAWSHRCDALKRIE